MTAPVSASKRQGVSPTPEIDVWTHRLGALVERYPRFWVGMANRETRLLEERIENTVIDRPIFIAGLARSGSTILLELLARHHDTASHRYRDFPLVLTPWFWNWFVDRAGNREQPATERAHRDRIKVTPESPEAFEELVWMAFFPRLHDPSTNGVFDAGRHHPRFDAFYRDHIRKLLALRGAPRYLSKGNYNVTRLHYLKELFPDAHFIVPVRDPIWHVASLMKQHRLFAAWESQDPRIRAHMRRSGHFEFGLDRRPVNTGDHAAAAEIARLWESGEEVEGWAAQWAAVYGHVATALEEPALAEAALVVRYEELCRNPGTTLAAVLDHCMLADDGLTEIARATVSAPTYYEPSFTEAERHAIRDRANATARSFGYE